MVAIQIAEISEQEKVKEVYQEAWCPKPPRGYFRVVDAYEDGNVIGRGRTRVEAWRDAWRVVRESA